MIVNKYNQGGGGSGSGVTPQEVQAQIDSALTPYWDSAATESAITEAVEGKADAKTIVDFDHTSQAERASIYAELKTLYDAGSGGTINKNYDFYKTVNTWQGLKIDYYSFSADTLVFGKVVSPENLTDQVVYEQVMTIDSAGTVNVVTNTVGGGGDMSGYYTSAQTDEKIASAVTPVANHLAEVEQITASAYTELHDDILALSARTPDMSAYTPTSGFSTINGSAITNGGNIVIQGGGGGDMSNYWNSAQTKSYVDSAATNLQDQIDTMDEVVSDALNDLNGDLANKVSSSSVSTIWKGTQAEYDLIVTKDPATFYIIVSSN